MRPVVEVENLVIRQHPKVFRGRSWVVLFLDERLRLRRAAQSVLLTLIVESAPRNGILRAHREVLRGLFSRAQLSLALRELEGAGITARIGDWIYLSPSVVYSGPASGYEKAMEKWRCLLAGGETQAESEGTQSEQTKEEV